MRRVDFLRLSTACLAAVVAVGCAAASSSPSASSPPDPSPSVTAAPASTPLLAGTMTIVSGREFYAVANSGTETTDNDIRKGRGLTLSCTDEANDPRVSGTTTDTWNYDFYFSTGAMVPTVGVDWGTRRLVNEGGAWEGSIIGVVFPGPRDEMTFWLKGSGGYAGLTYYMHVGAVATIDANGMSYSFEGIIFEGSPADAWGVIPSPSQSD